MLLCIIVHRDVNLASSFIRTSTYITPIREGRRRGRWVFRQLMYVDRGQRAARGRDWLRFFITSCSTVTVSSHLHQHFRRRCQNIKGSSSAVRRETIHLETIELQILVNICSKGWINFYIPYSYLFGIMLVICEGKQESLVMRHFTNTWLLGSLGLWFSILECDPELMWNLEGIQGDRCHILRPVTICHTVSHLISRVQMVIS